MTSKKGGNALEKTDKPVNNTQYKTVKLVSGYVYEFDYDKIIGYCHYKIHYGGITRDILKKHECVSKQCKYFEKYEDSPYWLRVKQNIERKALRKEIKKNIAANKAARQAKILDEYEQIRQEAQLIANNNDYNIIITRVIPSPIKNGFKYIVNYVSDANYGDWYTYRELATELGKRFHCKFKLSHVRLPDGRYMIIDEWIDRV